MAAGGKGGGGKRGRKAEGNVGEELRKDLNNYLFYMIFFNRVEPYRYDI